MENNNKPEEKYKFRADFENIEISPPSKENIDKLVKQSQGDPSFFVLCMYSFIESYIRQNFPEYSFKEKQNETVYFWMLIKALQRYHTFKRKDQTPEEYFKTLNKIERQKKLSDKVRHNFETIPTESIDIIIEEFKVFARVEGFITKEIKNIPSIANWGSGTLSKEGMQLTHELNKQIRDLQKEHNNELEQEALKLEMLEKELENKDRDIYNLNDSLKKLQKDIQELKINPLSPEDTEKLKKLEEQNTNLKKVVERQRQRRDEIQEEHEKQVEILKQDVETYLENTTILQAYTSAARNFHARILKLSPEQEQIVDDIFKELSKLDNTDSPKYFLIKGGPGTGKTFVLIKLLEKLLEKIDAEKLNKNVTLLTYTDSLSKYNQYLSQEYEKKNPESTERITNFMKENIQTFDSYFRPKMEAILGKSIYTLDLRNEQDTRSEEYRTIYQIFNKLNNHDTEQIMKEAFDEIWTFVPTEKEYISKSYLGTGITLSDEQKENRQLVWNTVEKAMLEIEKLQSIPATFAYYKISSEPKYRHLSDEDKIDYLLIDEIQDLSPARIETISKLNKHSCVMAGDLNQSVFIKRKLSWIALLNKLNKTKIKPEIYTLQKNYRSTINIQNLANQYREICDIKDDSAISKSFIPGQDPELSISKNLEDALDKILTQVQCYINVLNFNPEDICIVVPSDEELTQITGLLHDHQLKAMAMDNSAFDFAQKNVIRLSTTKQVKGVDSPIIILLLTANFVDTNKNGNTDPMSQMNSIYSCITRTMDLLYVQITEDALTSKLDNKKENSVTKLLKVWKE